MPLYSSITYTCFDGGFDPEALDYGEFFQSAQNPCGGDPFC